MKSKYFVFALLLNAVGFGQYNWKAFVSNKPLHPASRLTVTLKGLPAGSDWILAVQADANKSPSVSLAGATLGVSGVAGKRSMQDLAELPGSLYTISNDTVVLNLQGAPFNGFVIYAIVPPGLNVTCTADQMTVLTNTPVRDSLLIRTGQILNEPATPSRAIARLRDPQGTVSKVPPPDYIDYHGAGGGTFASQDNVRRHVLVRPDAIGYFTANDCGCIRRAMIVIDINANGLVANVVQVQGDGDIQFRSAVSEFVKRWTFTPFLRDNQPQVVRAAIILLVGRDGSIKTSLD